MLVKVESRHGSSKIIPGPLLVFFRGIFQVHFASILRLILRLFSRRTFCLLLLLPFVFYCSYAPPTHRALLGAHFELVKPGEGR